MYTQLKNSMWQTAPLLALIMVSGAACAEIAVPSARVTNTQSIRMVNPNTIYSTPTANNAVPSSTVNAMAAVSSAEPVPTPSVASTYQTTSSVNNGAISKIATFNNTVNQTPAQLPPSTDLPSTRSVISSALSNNNVLNSQVSNVGSRANAAVNKINSISAPASPFGTQVNTLVTSANVNTTANVNAIGTPNAAITQNNMLVNTITPNLTGNSVDSLSNIPTPQVTVSNIDFVKTVLIPKTRYGSSDTMDVSVIDDFIAELEPKAKHYPPNFKTASERYYVKKELKEFEDQLRPLAESPDASYDILLRAAKLNGMGRNLDLGSDYAIRGSNYIDRAIKLQPNSAEANFIYGLMLSEGGGFSEGAKYLNRAASNGYLEAEQSLAQSDLLTEKRSQALSRLQRLQRENPTNSILPRQIAIVQNGGFYIWDISTD